MVSNCNDGHRRSMAPHLYRSWSGSVFNTDHQHTILGSTRPYQFYFGWLAHAQRPKKQRQDRYIIPAYPLMSTGLVMAPSLVTVAAIPFVWQVTRENISLFNSNTSPAQRDYSHDVSTPAQSYPVPHEAYWPISHDLVLGNSTPH